MYKSYELLLFLALIPGLFILFKVYTNDRIEREPFPLILKLVFLGVFSTVPAVVLELLVDALIVSRFTSSRLLYALTNAFLSAALVEEGLKFLFLRSGSWKRPEFDYRYDAIVYAVSVSLGFAMLENVLYVFQNGIYTAILRAFCSVPLHAFCGVFMGFHYGLAKQALVDGDPGLKRSEMCKAFVVPFLIHGTADALLMYGSTITSVLFLFLLIGLYFVAIRRLRYCAANDVNFVTKSQFPPLNVRPAYYGPVSGRQDSPSPFQRADAYTAPPAAEQAPVRRTNGWSVVGFICGILSYLMLTVILIPNLLAIIFSAIGLSKQRNNFGIAGLILGISSSLIGAAMLACL